MSGDDDTVSGSGDDEVSQARLETGAPPVPPAVLKQLEAAIPVLAERVTQRVQAEIPTYAGPAGGRRRRLIAMAATESSGLFVRRLSGRKISTAGVDDLFRKMGYGEATDGHGLQALEHALRIAGREAWQGLQSAVVNSGLPASTLGRLGDELADYLDHLGRQAAAGHQMAARIRERDVNVNRVRLLEALVKNEPADTVQARAEAIGWALPSRVVLLVATATDPVTWPDADALGGTVLVDSGAPRALFLAPGEDAHDVVAKVTAAGKSVTVARSMPVSLEDVCHAHRWVTRALDLVETGVIPRQPVIDVAQYRTQLWLHAEPALRRDLAQELLKPLFAETPNSREILSETLLVWLETRDSAPAIAAILGVHPQTVRYRWRRINELFGESLHDPEFVVQLTMVLKASVPLWVAGDQSDFERYWNEEPA